MNCKRQVKGKTLSLGTNYRKRDSKSLYCFQMFLRTCSPPPHPTLGAFGNNRSFKIWEGDSMYSGGFENRELKAVSSYNILLYGGECFTGN